MSTCLSLQSPIRVSPPPQTLKTLITPNSPPFWFLHPTKKFGRTRIRVSEADPITAVPPSPPSSPDLPPAADVVRGFYGGINRRDLDSVGCLIAERCVYEDLVFSRPFVGRKDILTFFTKFSDSISSDLQFVIDDISCEDSSAIGVTWHLEWRGKPFPFSKGCSFYRLEVIDGKRQIIYGRDCVEPATKPGDFALKFPRLADRL